MNLRSILLSTLLVLVLLAPQAALAAPPRLDEKLLLSAMKTVMFQEPCCGACPRMTADQGRKLLAFVKGQDVPGGAALWSLYGPKILEQLQQLDPAQAKIVAKAVAGRVPATVSSKGR